HAIECRNVLSRRCNSLDAVIEVFWPIAHAIEVDPDTWNRQSGFLGLRALRCNYRQIFPVKKFPECTLERCPEFSFGALRHPVMPAQSWPYRGGRRACKS